MKYYLVCFNGPYGYKEEHWCARNENDLSHQLKNNGLLTSKSYNITAIHELTKIDLNTFLKSKKEKDLNNFINTYKGDINMIAQEIIKFLDNYKE